MNSLTLVIATICILVLAYRYISAFLEAKVLALDPNRTTPAYRLREGRDYHPTNRFVLFGHHFAAIAGAGPLIGPVLAAQFGYLPSFLWLIIGAVLAGATHDMVTLAMSVRYDGLSLSNIALKEVGKVGSVATAFAVLFIIITALAGLAIAVVNSMSESAWGTFTIAVSVPAALLTGFYMYRLRPGHIVEASLIGVTIVVAGVIFGKPLADSSFGHWFLFSRNQLSIALPAYGFIASVLPVWVLLCPRDYLSSYLKIGTIVLLAVGIFIVHPRLAMPAITPFVAGGGPIIAGKVWPFVCITVACGAVSGFHALIGSGTTPKMIRSEHDIRFIGYGAMLVECFVGVMALIAASVLQPGDYFAINAKPDRIAKVQVQHPEMDFKTHELDKITGMIGEKTLVGRTGGAVSLAVGMAKILSNIPGMKSLMSYWYHFVIMFEALFILTVIDTGTRVGRYIIQELLGKPFPKLMNPQWMPGIVLTSVIICLSWGYLTFQGDIRTIWPMFGVANQLLATAALAIGTTYILQRKGWKYSLITGLPMIFMLATTITAGLMNVFRQYLPEKNYLNAFLSLLMILLVVVLVASCVVRWGTLLAAPKKEEEAVKAA